MRVSNATLRRVLPPVIFVGAVLCLVLSAYLMLHKPTRSKTIEVAFVKTSPRAVKGARKTVNAGLPVRLKIPSIDVDAALDYVGLTSKGDLGAPKGSANAAWYSEGPRPGDSGNAVIDGHFGYKNNRPAVFDNLHALKKGDKIYVEDKQKVVTVFVVRELRKYSPNEDAAEVFQASDGKAHLNLITCEGAWDKAKKAYTGRLVVFSDKAIE